jgi:microcystin-dependent protein
MSEILNVNEFEANQGKIDKLTSESASIKTLDLQNSTIKTLTADFIKLKNQIEVLNEELKIIKGSKELVKISANRTDINTSLYTNNELVSLPVGAIVAFYGDKVPEGWAFCDGQNGTPDLRGSFIQGKQESNQKSAQVYKSAPITLNEKNIPRVWSTVTTSFYKAEAGTNGNNFDFLGTKSTSRNKNIRKDNSWCTDENISSDFAIGHDKPDSIEIPNPQHVKLAYIMKTK